ncbi:MAG TPA: hypothetical protein VMS38_22945, partial [Pseudorhodoferax sp.]|nr:hypothetical protein [Pseudorhodoferax sp.]
GGFRHDHDIHRSELVSNIVPGRGRSIEWPEAAAKGEGDADGQQGQKAHGPKTAANRTPGFR